MLADVPELRSFGRYDAGRSQVFRPTNVAEVVECFDIARKAKQRVTIRGRGHSFDSQALHAGDTGKEMIVSTEAFEPERIDFDPARPDRVTLGCGVQWRHFVEQAIQRAGRNDIPIYLPGSLQTGGDSTVGGTLAGDCLSRFSGTVGKESRWIESFRLLTPNRLEPIDVSRENNSELFHAVIGGHGYIGFVTDVTWILTPIDKNMLGKHGGGFKRLCGHTDTTTHTSLDELIEKQKQLIAEHQNLPQPWPRYPRAISAEWFGAHGEDPASIHGAVCDSCFAEPSSSKLHGFPLYNKLQSGLRYLAELMVRYRLGDVIVGWILYLWVALFRRFEDPVADFLFFMDGDTAAREKYEKVNTPRLFPLVQQTFVVPTEKTLNFTLNCISKIREHKLHPTECDMLFVLEDECLLSANYRLNGFAISFAFEQPGDEPPERVFELLRELSRDCLRAGGRIHLPKNSHVDRDVFRLMFQEQIEKFEKIKRENDPDLLLQNSFSDRLFAFQEAQRVQTAP